MLAFFISQIAFKSFLFFSQLSNFKLCLFVQSDKLHVEITDFILFFLTVFFKFSDLKLIFFVIVEMISFNGLNLDMVFVFEL